MARTLEQIIIEALACRVETLTQRVLALEQERAQAHEQIKIQKKPEGA